MTDRKKRTDNFRVFFFFFFSFSFSRTQRKNGPGFPGPQHYALETFRRPQDSRPRRNAFRLISRNFGGTHWRMASSQALPGRSNARDSRPMSTMFTAFTDPASSAGSLTPRNVKSLTGLYFFRQIEFYVLRTIVLFGIIA